MVPKERSLHNASISQVSYASKDIAQVKVFQNLGQSSRSRSKVLIPKKKIYS
jgi:hypothetical protein